MDNLFYGSANIVRAVNNRTKFQIRRKILLRLIQNLKHSTNSLHRVGVARKLHTEPYGSHAVCFGDYVVETLTGFNAGNVFQAYKIPFAVGVYDNISEFFGGNKTTVDFARVLFFLRNGEGHRAYGAGGCLDVLLFNRLSHIFNCKTKFRKFIGVKPNAHGIICAENLHIANARYALYLV